MAKLRCARYEVGVELLGGASADCKNNHEKEYNLLVLCGPLRLALSGMVAKKEYRGNYGK